MFILTLTYVLLDNFLSLFYIISYIYFFSVSGSNLANHFVGSLKKGSKPTSSPANYATLPSHHMRAAAGGLNSVLVSNSRVVASGSGSINEHPPTTPNGSQHTSPQYSLPPAHKRSPSTDSGNAGSRSTTPVSYRIGK